MTIQDQTARSTTGRLARVAARFADAGLALTVACALAVMLSALGTRWGWWGFREGFAILRFTLYAGLAVIVVTLTGLVLGLLARSGRSITCSLATVVLLVAVAWAPVGHLRAAQRVPPIHDITTDPDDPPRFVAVLPLRREAPNPVEYGGPALAAQQRVAYPDLGPARFSAPPAHVFEQAATVARRMGWEIVAAVPPEGRLEATDRTFWFGFRDDVVVRVAPADEGTRVDVRSVSRVGRSDLGTNARRIRDFLAALRAALPGETAAPR